MPNGINYDIVRFLTHALVNVNVHSHFQQIHLTWLFLVCFSAILFAPFAIHAALVQITSRTSYIHTSYACLYALKWVQCEQIHPVTKPHIRITIFNYSFILWNVVRLFWRCVLWSQWEKKNMFSIWVQGNFKVFCLEFSHTSNIKCLTFNLHFY